MLIITRKPGEKIMLGDDVVVHVMEIVGNSVRIGIQAPRSAPGLPRGDLERRPGGEPGRRDGEPGRAPGTRPSAGLTVPAPVGRVPSRVQHRT